MCRYDNAFASAKLIRSAVNNNFSFTVNDLNKGVKRSGFLCQALPLSKE
jgi:hypothetical protein